MDTPQQLRGRPDRAAHDPSLAPRGMPAARPVGEAEREQVAQALAVHFAHDRLSIEEFEERLERVYRAVSYAQLDALLADLPHTSVEELAAVPYAALVPTRDVPERGFLMAVMGGSERKGSWIVPRHLKVFVAAGGVELDLREARFGPGVTQIDITCFMGGVEVIVPPGVRVESNGAAFAGGFEAQAGDAAALSPLSPVLRLSGMVVFGGVETKTRLPGESERERKRRERETARRRQRGD